MFLVTKSLEHAIQGSADLRVSLYLDGVIRLEAAHILRPRRSAGGLHLSCQGQDRGIRNPNRPRDFKEVRNAQQHRQ